MKRDSYSTFLISTVVFALFSAATGLRLLYGFDLWALRVSQSWTTEFFDSIGEFFSSVGGIEITVGALLILVTGLFYLGHRVLAVRILIAFLITSAIEVVMKLWLPQAPMLEEFSRSNGYDPLVAVNYSYPYPSGHLLRTTILLGAVFILWRNRAGRIVLVIALAGMVVSRVYMGVHWASDVIGGILLGIVGLTWTFKSKNAKRA